MCMCVCMCVYMYADVCVPAAKAQDSTAPRERSFPDILLLRAIKKQDNVRHYFSTGIASVSLCNRNIFGHRIGQRSVIMLCTLIQLRQKFPLKESHRKTLLELSRYASTLHFYYFARLQFDDIWCFSVASRSVTESCFFDQQTE